MAAWMSQRFRRNSFTADRGVGRDLSDGEFAGLRRVAMEGIRNTLPSRRRQTSMMRVEAPFDLSFFIGSADVPERARESVETPAKKKNAAGFVLDESCLGCRKSSARPRRRGVRGQNMELFALAPED
ncbi:MAG: hypothetical protein WAM90_09850 [Rhodanobacter sp.]